MVSGNLINLSPLPGLCVISYLSDGLRCVVLFSLPGKDGYKMGPSALIKPHAANLKVINQLLGGALQVLQRARGSFAGVGKVEALKSLQSTIEVEE
jgi:hypothetical protein